VQYILSQEEYDALIDKGNTTIAKNKELVQALCTKVADLEIVTAGWYKGKPWGCVKSTEEEWYCDDCPVKDLCPERYKPWSK
jgi:hypothetical protein